MTAEANARIAADSAEQSAREAADSALQSAISAEESARMAAVSAEESRAMAAESALSSAISAEQSRAEGAESALDGRLDVLEARAFRKMKFVLTATDISNGHIDLGHEAMASSIVASVGRLMIHEGAADDFTVSTVGGVTRMTFVNSLVTPGQEKLATGDVVYVRYMA